MSAHLGLMILVPRPHSIVVSQVPKSEGPRAPALTIQGHASKIAEQVLVTIPQGLKPSVFAAFSARLKSCPDTMPVFEISCSFRSRSFRCCNRFCDAVNGMKLGVASRTVAVDHDGKYNRLAAVRLQIAGEGVGLVERAGLGP